MKRTSISSLPYLATVSIFVLLLTGVSVMATRSNSYTSTAPQTQAAYGDPTLPTISEQPTTTTTTTAPAPTTTEAPIAPPTTQAPIPTTTVPRANRPTTTVPNRSVGTSGGTSAFLNCVRNRESHGNYSIVNPSSGAGGAYQFLPSTWQAAGFARKYGVARAEQATPAQQDEAANTLYAGGAGASHWAGPGC